MADDAPADIPATDPQAAPTVEAAPAVESVTEPAVAAPEGITTLMDGLATPGTEREPAVTQAPETTAVEAAAEPTPTEATPDGTPEGTPVPPVDAAPQESEPEPTLAPVEYQYEIPAGMDMDDARRAEMHAALDAFRADPKMGAQKLLDLHHQAVQSTVQSIRDAQWKSWTDVNTEWARQIMEDPELGDSRFETVRGAVARGRDILVSNHRRGTPAYEKDMADFDAFTKATGAGNHPVFWRMLHRAAQVLDEAPIGPPNAQPTKTNGRRPGNPLHDHPRSNMDA